MSLTLGARALTAVVVLPTYNEAGSICPVLSALMETDPRVEVAVVDDASPDGTADLAQGVARFYPGRVHVLRRNGKDGLGVAYRYGFAWAAERGYDIVVQMDADGSHPPERLPAMLDAVASGRADLAVGSRYVSGGATSGWSFRRKLLSKAANGYARAVLGLHLRDTTGAYRAWRASALLTADPWSTTAAGYGFLVEMVTAAERAGLAVVEVPITFTERTSGCSKMTRAIATEAARTLWALRRDSLRWRHSHAPTSTPLASVRS